MVEFQVELTGSGQGTVDDVKAAFSDFVNDLRARGLAPNGHVNAHEAGNLGSAISFHAGNVAVPEAKAPAKTKSKSKSLPEPSPDAGPQASEAAEVTSDT